LPRQFGFSSIVRGLFCSACADAHSPTRNDAHVRYSLPACAPPPSFLSLQLSAHPSHLAPPSFLPPRTPFTFSSCLWASFAAIARGRRPFPEGGGAWGCAAALRRPQRRVVLVVPELGRAVRARSILRARVSRAFSRVESAVSKNCRGAGGTPTSRGKAWHLVPSL